MEFWVPYGTTEVPVRVPDDNFRRILEPPKTSPGEVQPTLELSRSIGNSLENPLGDASIQVKPGSRVGLLFDPLIAKPVQDEIVSILRARLASLGATDLIVRQRNRSTDYLEMSRITEAFTEVGRTVQGTKVMIDREIMSCDLKLLVGIVQPHFASGFIGGPDLVLPGVSAPETIRANRALTLQKFSEPLTYKENLVYKDSLEAAGMVGNAFLLTLVPDERGGVSSVYSGSLEATFEKAVTEYLAMHSKVIDTRPEIIVASSGTRSGDDLYHAVRVVPFLWNVIKRDASTIVLVAECGNGVGNNEFLNFSKTFDDRRALQSELKHGFKLGGHVALLLKEILEKSRVQLVSVLPEAYTRSFGLKPSRTVTAGVQSAIRAEGKEAGVLIVPQGHLTIPVIERNPASAA